jgi:hypothetical protein
MNIEYGAEALELLANENFITVPRGFRTFKGNQLPDFDAVYGKKPITVALGKPGQHWMNASLAEQVFKEAGKISDNVDPRMRVVRKIGLRPKNAKAFIDDAAASLQSAPYWPEPLERLIGVSFEAYHPRDIATTFFGAIRRGDNGPAYKLYIDKGHRNGWTLSGFGNIWEGLLGYRGHPMSSILTPAEVIYEFAKEFIGGNIVMFEGHSMKPETGIKDPMFIDLYEYYGDKPPHRLDHRSIIRNYFVHGYGEKIGRGQPPTGERLADVRALLHR